MILHKDSLPITEVVLIDVEMGLDKVRTNMEFARRMVKKAGLSIQVNYTLDRKEGLKDAAFVITQLRVGGLDALAQMGQATRVELARRTGISQPTVNVLIKEMTEQGEVFAIPQIPEWEHFGLQAYLEKACSRKVMVRNDINAVAMGYLAGERMNGSCTGKDGKLPVRNLVYLHVEGTGLGAGIIIDGRLYSGSNSFAGEAGYMQIGCDNLENQLTGADAAKRETILSKVLVNFICILNPEKIVLGGEITEKMTQHIKEQCCQCLPMRVMPEFALIPDSMEQYFMGLGQSALDLLDNQIRLH